MKVLASALALAVALAAPVAAGSWAAGKDGYYAKVGVSSLATEDLATPDGTVAEIPEFERQELDVYLEYGLSARWTAIARVPLRSESSIDGFGSAYGPGDLSLGLQRQLSARGPWVSALRASIQAPTGDPDLGEGLLPTGTGAWEGELLISLGRSLGGGSGWTYVEAGPRVRGSGLSDALAYRAQLGTRLGGKARLALTAHGIDPSSGSGAERGSAAGLGDGVRYLAYGPELHFDLSPGWVLEVGAEDTTDARNLATGVTLRIGLARIR